MTKMDIADAIAQGETISKRQALRIVERMLAECKGALEHGDRVALPPFGTFVVRSRKGREGRNPKTGAAISIPARKAVAFVPAKSLKEAVSGTGTAKKRQSKQGANGKRAKA